MQRQRFVMLAVAAAIAVAAVLLAVLRDDGGEDRAAPPPTTTAPSTTRPGAVTETVTTTTRARPRPRTLAITVRGGRVRGGFRRFAAGRGERVAIVVRADVRDEVHVHGYDLKANVAPGGPASIVFRARLVGRFEIELEQRGLHIAELEVRP